MTRDGHEAIRERLSEYVDGLLDETDEQRVTDHLSGCAPCRGITSDLVAVRDAARALEDRPPARDLWPGIQAALGGADDAPVIPLDAPGSGGRPPRTRRGVFLSLPQLSGIAAALVLVTAWSAWELATADALGPTDPAASVPAPPADPVRLAAERDPAVAGLADEVERLQRALAARRSELAPGTVDVLEKNLAIIDRAIRECLDALAVDPGNEFVEEHLRGAVQRKVEYLRDASALPGAESRS